MLKQRVNILEKNGERPRGESKKNQRLKALTLE